MTWIQTYSGQPFDLLDLSADQVHLVDVAAALSKLNRFAGHTIRFYSVAEHSVLVALRVLDLCDDLGVTGELRRRAVLAALLHDATEAYMADIPSPWKRLPMFDEYRVQEALLSSRIALKFGCEVPPTIQALIHQADYEMLAVEVRDVMGPSDREWPKLPTPPDGFSAGQCDHHEAEEAFLALSEFLIECAPKEDE